MKYVPYLMTIDESKKQTISFSKGHKNICS